MIRSLVLPLAFLAAPAFANGYYQAEPQNAPAEQRFVARDTVWQCAGGTCSSARGGSRPAFVCASVARELGTLRRFAVDGREFDAAELEACNRRAR